VALDKRSLAAPKNKARRRRGAEGECAAQLALAALRVLIRLPARSVGETVGISGRGMNGKTDEMNLLPARFRYPGEPADPPSWADIKVH
jgi:hypothetical protein